MFIFIFLLGIFRLSFSHECLKLHLIKSSINDVEYIIKKNYDNNIFIKEKYDGDDILYIKNLCLPYDSYRISLINNKDTGIILCDNIFINPGEEFDFKYTQNECIVYNSNKN